MVLIIFHSFSIYLCAKFINKAQCNGYSDIAAGLKFDKVHVMMPMFDVCLVIEP